MSLPLNYSNAVDYLRDALTFLSEHQWIYNFPNTHILVNDIFSYIPCDWFEYFQNLPNDDLNKLPVNGLKDCPITLKDLVDKIASLRPNLVRQDFPADSHKFSHNSGLGDKKRHEIVSLAPVINKICKDLEINLIIDVGSGLGYLSHYLNTKYGYKILGIECSKQYVDLALKNQVKFYPSCKNEVIFREHFINTESGETISTLVRSNFDSIGLKSSCLVGLHACADLSITILNVFCELDFIKSLIIMPCCYHRIKLKIANEDEECFINFPTSKILEDLFKKFKAQEFLKRPFLRLSCQQTNGNFVCMTKEEHERHAKNVMFRCILQEVAEIGKYQVKRLKRKSHATSSPDSDEDFELYLNKVQKTHCLMNFDSSDEQININEVFLEKMRIKWNEHKNKCFLIEVLTGLQSAIQGICENVILLDRVEYLKEKGYKCEVQKVTNDVLSPRCHAIVATKE